MNDNNQDQGKQPQKLGFMDILKSTLAGALGVQSNKNRERDFNHGSIKVYAIAGLIFTVVFITTVVIVVKIVLRNAGM